MLSKTGGNVNKSGKVSLENTFIQFSIDPIFKSKNPGTQYMMGKGVLSYKSDGFSCKNNL